MKISLASWTKCVAKEAHGRFASGLAGLGSLGNAAPAFACSCVSETPEEQFARATAIFVGEVKDVSRSTASGPLTLTSANRGKERSGIA
jgi:hypothetical protein